MLKSQLKTPTSSLLSALSLVLLSLPLAAASPPPTQSQSKTTAGIVYKLTMPKPLLMSPTIKMTLKLTKGSQSIKNAKLSASALMDDGMKSAVKITPKANGDYELLTRLDMGGEWQLKISQSAPIKSNVLFLLDVTDPHGQHHH